MQKKSVYSPKNVVALVAVFMAIFLLLYSLASFLHESRKISAEIESIRQKNEETRAEIEAKKKKLEYLQTPQRVDKEAKMQMGKKLPGENVLVFVEEETPVIPTSQLQSDTVFRSDVTPVQKWFWLFWGKRK